MATGKRDIPWRQTALQAAKVALGASCAILLARALGKLAEADAVIFAPGWETARGCRMEHLAAEEYGIRIVEG